MPKDIASLRQIVSEKQNQEWRYGNKRKPVVIDTFTAQAIVLVYDAVNDENKAKFDRMIAGEFSQFMRIAEFCMSKCR